MRRRAAEPHELVAEEMQLRVYALHPVVRHGLLARRRIDVVRPPALGPARPHHRLGTECHRRVRLVQGRTQHHAPLHVHCLLCHAARGGGGELRYQSPAPEDPGHGRRARKRVIIKVKALGKTPRAFYDITINAKTRKQTC